MQKFLVVGCGGSGTKTLIYLMDQLLSELAPYGIDRLPDGWQFVSIDVPSTEDQVDEIGSVTSLGGTYLSTNPGTGEYKILDDAVTRQLRSSPSGDGLGLTATWAPRDPKAIGISILSGAGQMRSVGRMVTLNSSKLLHERLTNVFGTLMHAETNAQMQRIANKDIPGLGTFDIAEPPLVLVVSSMSGGAGASMALDVCRVLNLVDGVEPGHTGVFMVTPDAFDHVLAPAQRGAVRANALSMLGEIIAAQMKSSEDHDIELLSSLGLNVHHSGHVPFARVFPVGRFIGTEGAQFGDGSLNGVYRGLARGLSGLMSSDKAARDFKNFDLTNAVPVPISRTNLGWDTNNAYPDPLPWGAFGFASLSMGRDRYKHYAAQRLARITVDHLLDGHRALGDTRDAGQQLNDRLDAQWVSIAERAGLPATSTDHPLDSHVAASWFMQQALPEDVVGPAVNHIVQERVASNVASMNSSVSDWAAYMQSTLLPGQRLKLDSAVEQEVYRWGFDWAKQLHESIVRQVQNAVAAAGLPFARKLLERVSALVRDQLITMMKDLARVEDQDLGRFSPEFSQQISQITGKLINSQAVIDGYLDSMRTQIRRAFYARAADRAAEVLRALATDVLPNFDRELNLRYEDLLRAQRAKGAVRGLANVHTTEYALWPDADNTRVPDRFDVADNEVLITPSSGFAQQFDADLPSATGQSTQTAAHETASRYVSSGEWPVDVGIKAPGGLLRVLSEWRPSLFANHPSTNAPIAPQQGQYRLALQESDILERARKFVERRDQSFERFCSVSLKSYLTEPGVAESELSQRRSDIAVKFGETLRQARPMTRVSTTVVDAVHGSPFEYLYKFSEVPFKDLPDVAESLIDVVNEMQNKSLETPKILENALSQDDKATRIDVFGSYRNYSPLSFASVLKPAIDEWSGTPRAGKGAFWAHRRSRPLPAALPMTHTERRAMVAGWYVAQLTGRLRIPSFPYTDPVRIWDDEDSAWVDFPNPLLTPPDRFHGESYDWLPAVLESVLLAIAASHQAPVMRSMRPYVLLRSMYDSEPESRAQGLNANYRRSRRLLKEWMDTGAVPSTQPSRASGDSPEARRESAERWLQLINDFVTKEYLPPHLGGASTGSFSVIAKRDVSSRTPMFRDLAPDIRDMTRHLQDEIAEAAVLNMPPDDGAMHAVRTSAPAPEAPDPGLGAF